MNLEMMRIEARLEESEISISDFLNLKTAQRRLYLRNRQKDQNQFFALLRAKA
jgi:hypothetical protein